MHGRGCDVSRAPTCGQLRVTQRLGVTNVRECMRFSRVSPDVEIVPFNNDIATLERAVKERVFFVKNIDKTSSHEFVPPPRPEPGVYSERLGESLALLRNYLPSTAPISHQQFVESFKGRKKLAYEQALEKIRSEGLSLKRDSSVKVFVKFEKTDRTTKLDPVPRVISPRDPKFNIQLGRYLRPIEERIFEALGELFGHKTVMKGMDTDTVAHCLREKWEMFNNPVAIGLDASRFDQHVSADALHVEHGVYIDCFPRKKDKTKLHNILKHQLKNHCLGYVEDGKLEYTVDGTRMSGDMNTSLGNCVLMCLMIHAYAQHSKVNVQLANNGDDCVVFMERRDIARFSEGLFDWFLEMGFNMAIEKPVDFFEGVEFCQCKPVFDGVKYTMCRNPYTAISKDSVMLKHSNQKNLLGSWLHAVGTGGIALAGGLPIFDSFYNSYLRGGSSRRWIGHRKRWGEGVTLADDVLPWYMRETRMTGKRVSAEPTAECRASFYLAWDVTPDEQILLERYYDSLSLKPVLVSGEHECRDVFQ